MLGVLLQEDWRVSRRFTVNLGLRWDKDFDLIGGAEQTRSRTYQALKAIGSPYAAAPKDDSKDFSQRIGFAFDIRGTGKHILRGGYGLYYGQTFINIPSFMLQQINPTLFATVLSLNSSGPGDPNSDPVPPTNKLLGAWRYGVDPAPPIPPALTQFQGGEVGRLLFPHYHNPYTHHRNIGYAYQINSANVVEIEYIHTLGLRESKTIDISPKDPNQVGTPLLNPLFKAKGVPQLPRMR